MTVTAAAMTQKPRAAIEALEAARKQGCSLTQYARAHGLNAQRIYAMLSALRKQGLLANPARKRSSSFVKVQVPTMPVSRPPGGPDVVCRVHGARYVIECLQWPPASWLASVSPGCTDAAA
jgi:hypothetical protein